MNRSPTGVFSRMIGPYSRVSSIRRWMVRSAGMSNMLPTTGFGGGPGISSSASDGRPWSCCSLRSASGAGPSGRG